MNKQTPIGYVRKSTQENDGRHTLEIDNKFADSIRGLFADYQRAKFSERLKIGKINAKHRRKLLRISTKQIK